MRPIAMLKDFAIWGRFAPIGLAFIALGFGIDQGFKWWMLYVYDISAKQPVSLTPFFDLVMVWNPGVSYGWFKNLGPWVLIAGQSLIVLLLWFWLAGSKDRISAIAVGLIIGGALGNITDRVAYEAVADFFHFYAFGYNWYIFNLADVVIVAGAAILVYGSIREMKREKS
ncbi:Lipoprotein signal peptidase [hydrothermal vent metagenome]|uniref:Lipoprotein signal peptidase n=1 Tax=hydrothermal vent metagenome TaxID=652676 RepID=A0A3B0RXF4_9ZZZZ